jgi:hypothetical protein
MNAKRRRDMVPAAQILVDVWRQEADGDGDSMRPGLSSPPGLSSDGLLSDGLSSPPGLDPVSDGVQAARAAAAANASTAIRRFMW